MAKESPDEFLGVAVEAAHLGGHVLQDWVGRFSVREKSRANLVTEADEASQKAIHGLIADRFPQHGYLGEEGLNSNTDADCCWIIDPLDGTSNYVHGFPYYAVSIALRSHGELIVGVVHDPCRNETFSAVRGKGARLNGRPIQTSGETQVASAMAMASLPIAADTTDPAIQRFLKAMSHFQTVQRTGSAALNLACVACGRIDAFWSTSLKPWDVAAGVLLVREAGGTVADIAGGPVDILVSSLLAASSETIVQDIADILK